MTISNYGSIPSFWPWTPANSVPDAPAVTATVVKANAVSLAWPSTGDTYTVDYSTDGGTTWSSVSEYTNNTALSVTQLGLVLNYGYEYRVRATNNVGNSGYGTASATTLEAISSLTASSASSSSLSVSWTNNSTQATGIRVERSTDNVNWTLVTTLAGNATSTTVTGLSASTLYYVRVRADSYNGSSNSGFYSTSATTAASTVSVDYLVVAGGGGGGVVTGSGGAGGGGGAGGFQSGTATLSIGNTYTITIGGGGATNTNGSNSVFNAVTSTGGGRGGTNGDGFSGGSGGGGGQNAGTQRYGGAGTSGQGNAGGNNHPNQNWPGGGGGGAGSVGGNGTVSPTVGGAGGAGASWYGTDYAGGGGGGVYQAAGTGGTGGLGGGGAGAVGTGSATAGTSNTGGGGGSSGNGGAAAAGGSGIVILRVPTASVGTYTGSPTVSTSGSTTIIEFKNSGSYTA